MLLLLIWQGTIVLSILSVAVFLGLYVRRLIIQRREAQRNHRRAEIKKDVVAYISSATPPNWNAKYQNPIDERILLGIASELLQSVSGTMRTRILTLLNSAIDIKDMLHMLRHGTAGDRAKVAARLFWSQDSSVHEALYDALHDLSPDVILAAAGSLVAIGRNIDLQVLLPILKTRQMLDHRGSRELLRRLAASNIPHIVAAINGEDIDVSILAIDAVGKNDHPDLLAALKLAATRHRNHGVRAAAVRALGNLGEGSAADAIAQVMEDSSWEVRVQAAIAAGRLNLIALVPELVKCLSSENWWLQWRAAQALAKLGPEGERCLREIPFDHPAAVLTDIALAEVHSA